MRYNAVSEYLRSIPRIKTKDIDKFSKALIKKHEDVSDLRDYVMVDQLVHRTYFQVSLGNLKSIEEKFKFIEDNAELLNDWWHVDQLIQFVRPTAPFDFAFEKAKDYINSEMLFLRRWGYVLFLSGLQKQTEHTADILSLIKNDDEYYVQMAEAWLIADLAVFNRKDVLSFLEITNIDYSIAGKAIQKMCDSFRISEDDKAYAKALRQRWKN